MTTASDPIADLRRITKALRDLPPLPQRIMASHSVPYGQHYRQWMTNGDLVLWTNRGLVAEFTRRPSNGPTHLLDGTAVRSFLSIPIYNA